jgi:hypothetical protein
MAGKSGSTTLLEVLHVRMGGELSIHHGAILNVSVLRPHGAWSPCTMQPRETILYP